MVIRKKMVMIGIVGFLALFWLGFYILIRNILSGLR